jgi:methanogenic corrinoid protein MtbC1
MRSTYVDALVNLKEEDVLRLTKERLDAGHDPLKILGDCREAMGIIGKRYEEGEYFVTELVYSGEILKGITKMVKPKLTKGAELKRLGTVVIGTVEGDIHDLGKNIVTLLLEANGFEVHDLGVDVPPQKFVDAVKDLRPQIVGMSGLLTLSFDSMKRTVEAIKEAGLRNEVKIIIGGSLGSEKIKEYSGADAYAADAIAGIALAKRWVEGE